ncbi:MAG TPA: 5-formyltetrahydrofolate cyclo-ligase [Methylomirabilota bacterium]|jgi:5-formyltetrahydrofolate cyclo-ligase
MGRAPGRSRRGALPPHRRRAGTLRARARTSREPAGAAPKTADKQALREAIWSLLTRRRLGRFPFPLTDRIPNFRGAEAAAERLTTLPEWAAARRLKCNPDAAQLPVRRAALAAGKHVFMAVPRLSAPKCFLHLDPARLRGRLAQAATIGGAAKLGTPVGPDALGHIDLIVAGSVAVDLRGGRVGKGGGYSDLEFALAVAHGAVDDTTLVVTTVHDAQVIRGPMIPMTSHDVPVDVVATPTRLIRTRHTLPRPTGVHWDELTDAQLAAMPPLAMLASPRR